MCGGVGMWGVWVVGVQRCEVCKSKEKSSLARSPQRRIYSHSLRDPYTNVTELAQ